MSGQNGTIVFDHYGYDQGFTSRSSRGVLKASNGYIYIGTEQGLAKYDGHQFTYFDFDPLDSTSVSNNYLTKLCEDGHGRIWLIAGLDLNVFDLSTEKFTRIYQNIPQIKNKQLQPNCFIYDKLADNMWIGTNVGLYINEGNKIALKQLKFIGSSNSNIPIGSMVMDHDEHIWFGNAFELFRFEIKTTVLTQFEILLNTPKKEKFAGILSTYIDANDVLWLGSWGQGLAKYDIKTKKSMIYHYTSPTVQNGVLAINQSGLIGEKTKLWVGTTTGLMMFDIETEKFTPYISESSMDIYGVPSSVWDFYIAKPEGMWIASHNGLHKYDFNKQIFKATHFPLARDKKGTFFVSAYYQNKTEPDLAWMFVPYVGNYEYNKATNILKPLPPKLASSLPLETGIFETYMDSFHVLWVSTNDKGLLAYDMERDSFLFKPNTYFINNWVVCFKEHNGILYLGSRNGLFAFDRLSHKFNEIIEVNSAIKKNALPMHVYEIDFDRSNQIWMILGHDLTDSDIGVMAYNLKTRKIKCIKRSNNVILKKLSTIDGMLIGSDNQVYVSSLNGIAHFSSDGEFSDIDIFTKENGMMSNSVHGLVEDNIGNIWCSSNFGLMSYNLGNKTFRNFSQSSTNLGKAEYPLLTFEKQYNELLIFYDGYFISLKPEELTSYSSDIVITGVEINNQIYETKETHPTLASHQNQIRIGFSLLSYTNSNDNLYHYQLDDGSDNKWVETKSNYVQFDRLAPGSYTFKVKGSNGFGELSKNEALFQFIISPPFYKTTWFNIFLFFFLFLILFWIFKSREIHSQRINALRLSIARDLHDDMGSNLSNILMMSELEIMRVGDTQKTTYRKIAEKTKMVMDSMSEIVWSINPQYDRVEDVIIKIQDLAIERLEPGGIQLHFRVDKNSAGLPISLEHRRNLYLIFKEAINNIAKYSRAENVILASGIQQNKYFISVEDDGKGFSQINSSKGNGLKNMKSRAKLLKGQLFITSNENGTKVLLELTLNMLKKR